MIIISDKGQPGQNIKINNGNGFHTGNRTHIGYVKETYIVIITKNDDITSISSSSND